MSSSSSTTGVAFPQTRATRLATEVVLWRHAVAGLHEINFI